MEVLKPKWERQQAWDSIEVDEKDGLIRKNGYPVSRSEALALAGLALAHSEMDPAYLCGKHNDEVMNDYTPAAAPQYLKRIKDF
jgi:hypothetical protein